MRARRIGLLVAITAMGIASACASDETPDDSTGTAVATDTPAVEPAPTEAPVTAPPRTDPPETEPPDTEPVDLEPVNTEAPPTEPITTDPPANEPVQNSPGDLEAWCLQWASDVPAGDLQTTFEGIAVRAEAMLAVAPQEIAEATAILAEKQQALNDFLAENDWDPTIPHPDPELAEKLNQAGEQVETYAAANC